MLRKNESNGKGGGSAVSKYDALWKYVGEREDGALTLTFEEIARIAGMALDHSFLQYKKELAAYGWRVKKISMKAQNVQFEKEP